MKGLSFFIMTFCLILLLQSCYSQNLLSDEFEIEIIELDEAKDIQKTIYYNGKLISLKSNGQLVVISEPSNTIDSELTQKINSQKFEDIFYWNNQIYGKTKGEQFKLLKNNKWLKTEIKNIPFYEDEEFTVSYTCSGEWGGSIFFIDKLTGKKYGCAATCPIVIEPLESSYLVTSTLAHLSGFSSIVKIENPKNLEEVKPKENAKNQIRYIGDDEINSKDGAQILFDSIGAILVTSFIKENKIYVIICDDYSTYISELINGRIFNHDTLIKKSLWSYAPENSRTGKFLVSNFSNGEISGFILINDQSIKLFKHEEKNH